MQKNLIGLAVLGILALGIGVFVFKHPAPSPPSEPFAIKLQAALVADVANGHVKAAQRVLLAGVYADIAARANDAKITTSGELLAEMRKDTAERIASGALV